MSLIISGVFDGPLSGGVPKGIELYVTADIADLSIYGLGSANNGGGSDGEEFTFPAVAATAGDYIYVASETTGFNTFFGFDPDYTTSMASINGDDAIELYQSGSVIDLYGDPNTIGDFEPWDYTDGWASRNAGSTATPTFNANDWSYSGRDALDGATDNATAATPVPIGSFGGGMPPVATITINEIDADQTGTDSAEFIELYDGGVGNTSLDGLKIVLFNGSNDMSYDEILLDGQSTDANGFFVVGSANVPNVDLIEFTTNGLQNGADAVALYSSGSFPNGTAPTTTDLVDAVAYDTNDVNDAALLAALGLTDQYDENENGSPETDAIARTPDGTATFVTQAATPGATNVIMPPATVTLIHDIQGTAGTGNGDVVGTDDINPFNGMQVTIEAIVTADFQDGMGSDGDLNGFFVQEEPAQYDADMLTSEGLFVFDGDLPSIDVMVGDLVRVTGTAGEFFGMTQITATDVSVVSSGNSVPTATTVTFPTANVAVDDNGGYVANLEAYEGMLVNIPQNMVMTEMFNLDRFGQYTVNAAGQEVQFTQDNAPDATGYDAHLELLGRNTIVLDDGSTQQNPAQIKVIDGNDGVLTSSDEFRMGDTISDITGVLQYSFDEFRIQNGTGTYTQTNDRPDMPADIGGNFKVASLNVLNYFTTLDDGGLTDNGSGPRGANNATEFARQAEKLVDAIVAIDADVLGLVELENDFAGTNFAIKDLVDRVNVELGSTVYAFVDPGQEFVGGDAISNGFIYKTAEVGLVGGVAILETHNGRNFLDPLGAGRDLNRPAVAQTFEDLDTGETVTMAVNHLKSKGSLSGLAIDDDQGDGAGNNNGTRTEAADILAEWLASDPTGQGSANTLILGDLNAYAMEDPITELVSEGYTDLAASALGSSAYSYVFDGQIGTLDYAMANAALTSKLAGVTEWHINADEPDAFDYNLDFGRDPTLFSGATPARNSDHDPVIVSFNFTPVVPGPTPGNDFLSGTSGDDTVALLAGDDTFFAGSGADEISGNEDNDVIFGDDGTDDLNGNGGDDKLFGGNEDDTLTGELGEDTLYGEVGADMLIGDMGNDRLHGGPGNDDISGGENNDTLFGEQGEDTLAGGADDDKLFGGDDNDTLNGDAGMDTLVGGMGDDSLEGGDNLDRLYGDEGNDTLKGEGGDDILIAGIGNDSLLGGIGNDRLNGQAGMDTLEGGDGDDQLNGGADDDTVDGGIGNDRLIGGDGMDSLSGGADNDTLFGGNADDTLEGDDGDDRLDGDIGSDLLTGGFGADTFILSHHQAASDGDIDRITDMDWIEDQLIIRAFNGNAQVTVNDQFELLNLNLAGLTVTGDVFEGYELQFDEAGTSHSVIIDPQILIIG